MARTAILGFPRLGPDRELKQALESHWAGETSAGEVEATARRIREGHWRRASDAGIEVIPSGDFTLYDHVLDTAWLLDAIPERFGGPGTEGQDAYFAMARGTAEARPLEMTKWFDTNYHYLVPELSPGQRFRARPEKWLAQYAEARELGVDSRPAVLGPLSFLLLAKGAAEPLELLDGALDVYEELIRALGEVGAREVQVDEPCLVTDLPELAIAAAERSISRLAAACEAAGMELSVATYFEGLDAGDQLERVLAAPAHEVHLDLVRAPDQLEPALEVVGEETRLSLGLIDGRNVWVADLDRALAVAQRTIEALGPERVTLAPSCSLLHLPYEARRETEIDPTVLPWLAFAYERIEELATLSRALDAPASERESLLAPNREARAARAAAAATNDPRVRERVAGLRASDYERASPYAERRPAQRERLDLPELPATTIGSFPQTEEIRRARRELRDGTIDQQDYEERMRGEIRRVVDFQEALGFDVLVHGEPERNDMVEYFGRQLRGFCFTEHGWVQSYGSRGVRPPIVYGDVSRPGPMTVDWWRHAQSSTERPVKGMLTGPVTILQWSFVRDDQPRQETCTQIALAMHDEVLDLEAAGAVVIQVDEAALREGLPLHAGDRDDYLQWAIDCFRLTAAGVGDATQVHSHMCYSEFNDMMEHIARLDADVLSIEASRSDMELLDAFRRFDYPNEIGPGVYDIHSPRVPSVEEIEQLLERAEERIARDRLWVNPDCGLKTRSWSEVEPALTNLVEAARRRRAAVPASA